MGTKIGKDVIESLTQAMYEDSRFVYREYIQNSADQIDKAVTNGILKKYTDGNIYIDIDKTLKRITIMDNATGIQAEMVVSVLKNIAKSPKDRSKDKGFRGIGRLGGLAYCDRLIFETSFQGEHIKSIMTWDAKKLKNILNDRHSYEDASDVIDSIVEVTTEKEDISEHYFNVIMQDVTDPVLLDKENIKEYLSMVAPVPYNSVSFKFSDKIYQYAKAHNLVLDEYKIFVNTDLIKKAYTNYLYNGGDKSKKFKYDEILDIEFFDITDKVENLIAWGWFSISSFNGLIPPINSARGIRLRKGNIQIGLEDCLEKFHKEKRGNSYFFGEIHAIDPLLIPNSRRDYFVDNYKLQEFNDKIKDYFSSKLYRYYHLASDIRSQMKSIKKTMELKIELKEKEKKGYKNIDEKNKLEDQFILTKVRAIKSESKLKQFAENLNGNNSPEKRILSSVIKREIENISDNLSGKDKDVNKVLENFPQIINSKSNLFDTSMVEKICFNGDTNKIVLITDKLKLNNPHKKFLDKIIDIIDKALPKDLSKSLIQKIVEELNET